MGIIDNGKFKGSNYFLKPNLFYPPQPPHLLHQGVRHFAHSLHKYNKTRPPIGGLFRFGEFPTQALLEVGNLTKRKEGCRRQTGFVGDYGSEWEHVSTPTRCTK